MENNSVAEQALKYFEIKIPKKMEMPYLSNDFNKNNLKIKNEIP